MVINIKKDNHYCDKIIPIFRNKTISGKVIFQGEFKYDIDKRNQGDTNKLIGLSDSYNHHRDSIRFGWTWNTKVEKLELKYTLYRNSKRYIEHICFIESDKEYDFEISVAKGKYLLWFGGKYLEVYRSSKWFLPRKALMPFFGGDVPAPKKFTFNFNLDSIFKN